MAACLDLAAQAERRHVAGIELEHFLELLERQRVFGLLKACACALQELGDRLLPHDLIDLCPQHRDLRIDVAFGLELADNFTGELIIPFSSALEAVWMRGCVLEGSNSAIGSFRTAFWSVSPNSLALS